MHFSYYAKKISGEEMKGVLEAKDKYDLARVLRQQGLVLVSCKEEGEKKSSFHLPSIFGRIPVTEKMFFSRNLSVMISAGVSVSRGLEILGRQTKNKKFKKIIEDLVESIKKGTSMSESMKQFPDVFTPIFIAMVKVGEESGRLSDSLGLVSDQMERDHNLIKKIRGALMYPSIIVIAMILIGILMLIYVVPTLVSTFQELGAELPLSTKIIIAISNFLSQNTLAFFGIVLAVVAGAVLFFRSPGGKKLVGNVLLRLPIFSELTKKVNSARTARTMASLISAGVDVLESLNITREVIQNENFKKVLEEARGSIQKGEPVSESFKRADNLYPILVGEMMAVGEETGKFSDMLMRVAVFYEDEVTETTKDMSTIIEPILMVIIGAVVGFFALSMIKPMYSMVDAI
ncbi:MAG: type II secretion system F family protein [Candidatus Paceibacterota bacterium]